MFPQCACVQPAPCARSVPSSEWNCVPRLIAPAQYLLRLLSWKVLCPGQPTTLCSPLTSTPRLALIIWSWNSCPDLMEDLGLLEKLLWIYMPRKLYIIIIIEYFRRRPCEMTRQCTQSLCSSVTQVASPCNNNTFNHSAIGNMIKECNHKEGCIEVANISKIIFWISLSLKWLMFELTQHAESPLGRTTPTTIHAIRCVKPRGMEWHLLTMRILSRTVITNGNNNRRLLNS